MKVLIIRYSSIGDILVTTPIIRCVKNQLKAEVHYLCKKNFHFVLESNPFIDKFHFKQPSITKTLSILKQEKFDLIIDLQKSIQSRILCLRSGIQYINYNKLNFEKWIYVNLKIDKLPEVHLVERYFDALKTLGVLNDENGLDFFYKTIEIENLPLNYNVIALGAAHRTKRIPIQKTIEIISKTSEKIILVGGQDVFEEGEEIANSYRGKFINFCGKTSFNETAIILEHANEIYTGDTGVMHLAAALKKSVIVLWGNTTPKFGMYPYYGKNNLVNYVSKEVELPCRPCSKLGYDKCPKGHFKCMMEQVI